MKFVEDQRVGLEPVNQRYVNFGSKVSGKYLYYSQARSGAARPAQGYTRPWMRCSIRTSRCFRHFRVAAENFDEKDSILEEGLIPCEGCPDGDSRQVAFRGNAQAFEYAINPLPATVWGIALVVCE
jgi:hypothetical protein